MRKARKKIEATQVEDLAFVGGTLSEMAIFLDCSEDTLYRRFHKAIKRGIVCRTIFLRRRRFDLAMKGNTAALKSFRDTCAGEPSEQSTNPKFHEEQASVAIEKLTQSILKRAPQIDALYDKTGMKEMKEQIEASYDRTGMKELILAQRRRLETKKLQSRLRQGTFVEQATRGR